MIQAKQDLLEALGAAVREISPQGAPAPAFESPKQAAHGDLACTLAMPLAKALKKNPREVAGALVEALQRQPAVVRWVASLEIAGPGFINLRLTPAAKQAVVAEALVGAEAFGRQPARPDKVLVEFVSANPTGPLHLGHARQAALGDAICTLFETQGWQVTREFYYNDAGVQIATLANSVQARLRGLKPGDTGWPEPAYNGDYIADIASDFFGKKTVSSDDRAFTASGDPGDLDSIRQFAVAYLRHEQDLDLQAFGVRFDQYFLESSLYSSGRVDATVQRLIASGKTFEEGGALWLRTTEYGDDKDRVMRKSAPVGSEASTAEATYTYFVPDVAYHLNKVERGFTRAINIQGSDHHGTIARVRGGIQAAGMGVPAGYPDYLLHKMVTVMKSGAEVKISKRAGSYVTLRDLIDWTSKDAVRFFLLSRKADTEFVFDVDLALKQNDENPVFYVQYAHARICSVIQQFIDRGGRLDANEALAGADLSLLIAPSEMALMLKLAEYPDLLAAAAADLAPHLVAFYLRDVAGAFHSYYAAERFLVDDADLTRARLALLVATRQVIRNALAVLGVSAPERMNRGIGTDMRERAGTSAQRGGFVMGLIVGLLIGLALALGVALYVTKVPVPFVNKVPQRTAGQDAAEAEKNKNWDPNSPLYGKNPARPMTSASGAVSPDAAPAAVANAPLVPPTLPPAVAPAPPRASAPASTRDPAAILADRPQATPPPAASAPKLDRSFAAAPTSDPFVYFVQAGAYSRTEDAEQQRAKLALMGLQGKLNEREQSGHTVYRVRLGPFDHKDDAEAAKTRLDGAGIDAALVRVQR